jgi:hypothetical protein
LQVELTKVRLEVMDGEGKTRGVADWTSLIFWSDESYLLTLIIMGIKKSSYIVWVWAYKHCVVLI